MEITEVRIKPVNSEGRLLAFASITIDDCFAVHNLKVIDGRDGLFVAMPSRRLLDGSHKDIAHPVNNTTRKSIEETVLREYEKATQASRKEPQWDATLQDQDHGRKPRAESEKEVAQVQAEVPMNEYPFDDEEEDEDSFWATL